MKRLVIGLLAHVDSGKTTLAEGLLYRAGVLRKLGRVDHRDAFLDTDSQERARGITIFAKQAVLTLPAADGCGETALTLLDTPGHVDFSAEAERALQVLDYAVLVISGSLHRARASGSGAAEKSTQPSPKRPRSSRRRTAASAPGRSILLTKTNVGTR